MKFGEQNPNCVLTDKDIKEIKKLYKSGLSQNKIAKQFYISQAYVSMVLRGLRRLK